MDSDFWVDGFMIKLLSTYQGPVEIDVLLGFVLGCVFFCPITVNDIE